MSNVLQIKRGLKASIPTLAAGELAFCTDTYELYAGTGSANKIIGGPNPTFESLKVSTALAIDANGYSVSPQVGVPGTVFRYSHPANIIPNGDMESWTTGISTYPDGFTFYGSGTTVTREATADNVKQGQYSAKIVSLGTGFQGLLYSGTRTDKNPNSNALQTYTISFWYKALSTNVKVARFGVYDTVTPAYIFDEIATQDDAWHFFARTFSIRDDSLWYIRWAVAYGSGNAGDTLYVDQVMLTKGSELYYVNQASVSRTGDVTRWGGFSNFGNIDVQGTITATAFAGPLTGNCSGTAANVTGTVATDHGGTGQTGYAVGDLLYASGAAALSKLADVAAGSFLRSGGVGAAPAWSTLVLPNAATAGDMPYASGANTYANLAKGTAYQALGMNSGATAPAWMASLQSILTAAGDIIYASGANTPARLAKGTANQVLRMNSGATAPEWATPSAVSGVIPGSIIAWPTATVPTGYLECNGAAVNRTTYADLFAVISDDYGAGDGSTTFNLPDFRGYFLRGWAHGQTTDPDKASRTDRGDSTTGDYVGTKQADAYKSHQHTATTSSIASNANSMMYGGSGSVYAGCTVMDASGGNETRPLNVNVMWCIKY